jgi:hypothetical protein
MRGGAILLLLLAVASAAPKPLGIERITISDSEDGPRIPTGYRFAPGESVFFSFQVSGYKPVGDETPRVSIAYTMEVRDPAGVPIVEPYSGTVDTTLDPEDKNWMPKIRRTIVIPPFAPGGDYEILISLTARVAQKTVNAKTSFQVRGEPIEANAPLAIRDLHFYRSEDAKEPLSLAAYRPGDTVWVRFDMTGFKLGDKNRFEAGYGVAVLRPNGETMFHQDDAAVEKGESFYPRRHIPATFSLNLDKDLRPGEYTLVLTASDKIGGQSVEARQTFTVEK